MLIRAHAIQAAPEGTQFVTCDSHRAQVEHPFLTIKRIFGYANRRYRVLAKNTNRLYALATFTNLMRARPYIAG